MNKYAGIALLLIVALCPAAAFAHKMNVFAHAHGDSIHGEAYFRVGVPVQNAAVTALDPAGEKIGETKTDEQGKFTLPARFRCDHRLLVTTGGGHGAEFTVAAAELPNSLPQRPTAAPEAGSQPTSEDVQLDTIRAEVVAMRNELRQYEQRIRFRDVLGGIGYIVGIAGVAFYFLGARRRRSG